jgi:hypothetical protein
MNNTDLGALRLPSSFDDIHATKQIVTVPIRKPTRQEWVRLQDGEGGSPLGPVAAITIKDDAVTYVVRPDLVPSLQRGEYDIVYLHAAISTSQAIFLWPVRIASDRQDAWTASMQEAVALANRGWVRVTADMAAGHYDVHTPVGELAAPVWPPDVTFQKIVDVALKDRLIDSPDHPVLRRLRGDF